MRDRMHEFRVADDGMTLTELLVTMMILGIVAAISAVALINGYRVTTRTSDEDQGLSDVKTVTERLSRDLREARGVDSTATSTQLSIWIDDNSDYVKQATEIYTWKLVAAGDGVHFRVQRSHVDAGGATLTTIVGRTLVDNAVFTYNTGTPSAATTSVTVTLTYDPLATSGSKKRQLVFTERLRNV
jgi:prepilin-type N-terminal cleavage/methylation domain-containing protein